MKKNTIKNQKTDNGRPNQWKGLIIKRDSFSKEIKFYQITDKQLLYKLLIFIRTSEFCSIVRSRCDEVTYVKKKSLCEDAYVFHNTKASEFLNCQYFYTEVIPGYIEMGEEEGMEQFSVYQKNVSLALYTFYFIKEILESLKRENR